ncbi:MAG TPA: ABC transporter substrate-binding protein [Burkholderiaceae bacterium]|nr:ABC transporter substrate-binding protein [Burkholderiaceae bacterium]HMY99903.1 ABC transporter substrate-binding protein [Burkholderiaceae bacterium]
MKSWAAQGIVAGLLGLAAGTAHAVTLTLSCATVGQDFALCKQAAQDWAARSGNTVRFFTTPQSTTDLLALLGQIFSARSPDLDVVTIDMVWSGLVRDHLQDLRPYTDGAEQAHFPSLLAIDQSDGHLLAMPWYMDAGLLYYRRDLLEKYGESPPATWEALAATARKIVAAERQAGATELQGYLFQGRGYEGLTCNLLEWLVSHGGGRIVEDDGRISVHNPRAQQALRRAAGWIGTISPAEVLNHAEEDSRRLFQAGQAVFMRNWPYAWPLLQGRDSAVAGRVGVMALPRAEGSTTHAAALGGWQLAVSRYSRHPREAAALVMHLTSRAVQKERAMRGAYPPTIPALYRDAEVLAAVPFFGSLYPIFLAATPRPSKVTGAKYDAVSAASWETAHAVLSGRSAPEPATKALAQRLQQLRGRHW